MARGLPDNPPEDLATRFIDAGENDTCPSCGWDPDDDMQDLPKAHELGRLLAVELADGPIFGAMGGAQALAMYWRCPDCEVLFTIETEEQYGAMA